MSAYEPVDLEEIGLRLARTGALDQRFTASSCQCGDSPHENALHDLAADDVPAMLAEIKALRDVIREVRAALSDVWRMAK